jgi:hypothetical protein
VVVIMGLPTETEEDVAGIVETPPLLRFRLRIHAEGSARPREVVQALLGEIVADHRFRRDRQLARRGGTLVSMRELGPMPR